MLPRSVPGTRVNIVPSFNHCGSCASTRNGHPVSRRKQEYVWSAKYKIPVAFITGNVLINEYELLPHVARLGGGPVTGPEHYAEAERLLALANHDEDVTDGWERAHTLSAAQAHATLGRV